MLVVSGVYRRYFQDGCLVENQRGTLMTIKNLLNPPTTQNQYAHHFTCTERLLQLKFIILVIFLSSYLLLQYQTNLHIYIFDETTKLGPFQDGCLAPVVESQRVPGHPWHPCCIHPCFIIRFCEKPN